VIGDLKDSLDKYSVRRTGSFHEVIVAVWAEILRASSSDALRRIFLLDRRMILRLGS
jgi:hypothetical protein